MSRQSGRAQRLSRLRLLAERAESLRTGREQRVVLAQSRECSLGLGPGGVEREAGIVHRASGPLDLRRNFGQPGLSSVTLAEELEPGPLRAGSAAQHQHRLDITALRDLRTRQECQNAGWRELDVRDERRCLEALARVRDHDLDPTEVVLSSMRDGGARRGSVASASTASASEPSAAAMPASSPVRL